MLILPLTPLLLSSLISLHTQQSGIGVSGQSGPQQESGKQYLVVEIRARDDKSEFEFEAVQLSRSGKETVLQRFDGRAPYKLSVNLYAHLIFRGKTGQGKLGIRYKVEKEEKRSFQYLNASEAVVLEFRPSGVAGPGTHWYEGKGWPFSPLVFTALTVE